MVTDVNVKVDRIVHLASILGCTTSCLPLSYHQPFGLVIFRWIGHSPLHSLEMVYWN